MKEQRIIIEIDRDGRITADAEGFSGDACLQELDRLLEELAAGVATVERKPAGSAVVSPRATLHQGQSQSQGKKR